MTFAELRMKERWTRRLLANELGIDQSTIAKWETTKGYPTVDTLKKVADILGVTAQEVIASLDKQKQLLNK